MQDAAPRVLLTGSGSIARRHAANLRELTPGSELLMVCTRDEAIAWAQGAGVTPVRSTDEGLARKPHLAVICSITSRHAEELDASMDAVEGLYIEKPVVHATDAAAKLQARIDAGWRKPSVVGCNLRYHGAIRAMKRAIERGDAGAVAIASLRVGQWLPDWRPGRDWRAGYSAQAAQGGGVLFDLVHEIDSAAFLFGAIARGQAVAHRASLGIAADAAAAVVLQMRSGLPVHVAMDYVSRRPVREYVATGDRGTLRLDLPARSLVLQGADGVAPLSTIEADWDMAATYRLAVQDLLDAWRTGGETQYPLHAALPVTHAMIDLHANAWRPEA